MATSPEKDGDPAKEALTGEKENNSKWFQMLKSDLRSRKLSVERAEALALNTIEWRRISFARCVDYP